MFKLGMEQIEINERDLMKPRSKPGKIGSAGREARAAVTNAKPLSASQMEHLRHEKPLVTKAGKGGRRANWDIDYEEGYQFSKKNMPDRDNGAISQDGIRKVPKNGH